MKRYFEFIGSDGKTEVDHSKFWEIWVDGTTLRTRYGKIGANGQTTLKSFDSSADAEAAMTKAIAEKVKKGYTEPDQDDSELGEDLDHEFSPKLDKNDPEAIAVEKAYASWAKKYVPLALVEFGLTTCPPHISESHFWTLRSGDYEEYLSNGFQSEAFSGGSNSPVVGYVITKKPYEDSQEFIGITTEIRRWCDKCEGEGEYQGEDCDFCETAGSQYYEVACNYPLFISTQEELDKFVLESSASSQIPGDASSVKFCSECGTKREPLTAKFCSECGHSF